MRHFFLIDPATRRIQPASKTAMRILTRTSFLRALHVTAALICLLPLLYLAGCGANRRGVFSGGQAPARAVVENAFSQVGARYTSGGASPHGGFDCSGLVHWAYTRSGISIPRITRDQARAGRFVSREALRPADILIFKTAEAPNGLHTAIYAGNGRFVHSPSSGKRVRTDSLGLSYWKNTYIGARRIIQ
jgi:cell wall-associated NlpC family hydrolase